MKRGELAVILSISLLFIIGFTTSCYWDYERAGGGIQVEVVLPSDVGEGRSGVLRRSLERDRVDRITARVIDGSGAYVTGATFPVSASEGVLEGVPPGIYLLVVEGVTESGEVRYRGEKGNIEVVAGGVTDAGVICMEPVNPLPPVITEYPEYTSSTSIEIRGKKEACTALYWNNNQALSSSENRDWSLNVPINPSKSEQVIDLEFKTANSSNTFSEPVTITVTYDSLPPDIRAYNFQQGIIFDILPPELMFVISDFSPLHEVKGAIVKNGLFWDGGVNFVNSLTYFPLTSTDGVLWLLDTSTLPSNPGDYVVRIYATDSAGNASVKEFSFSVTPSLFNLQPPNILNLLPGSGWVFISWDAQPSAYYYHIYYGEQPGTYNGTGILEGPSPITSYSTSVTLHFADPNKDYFFQIVPVDSNNQEGPPSQEINAGPFKPLIIDTMYSGGITGEEFGRVIKQIDDIDGDGFNEILITAPGAGCIMLGSGGRNVLEDVYCSPQTDAYLGASVEVLHNNILFPQTISIAVGAPYYDGMYTDEGAVFIFSVEGPFDLKRRPPYERLKLKLETIIEGDKVDFGMFSSSFGTSLANVGDIDGDGMDDLAVGAQGYDNGSLWDAGAVYVLSSTNYTTPISSIYGVSMTSGFGKVIAAGDLNGDYITDLILVGAPDSSSHRGEVYAYRNTGAGFVYSCTLSGSAPGDNFGSSIEFISDPITGFQDKFAVGAPGTGSTSGYVKVYSYDMTSSTCNEIMKVDPLLTGSYFGSSIAESPDYDKDGIPELLIGMPGFSCDGINPSGGAILMAIDLLSNFFYPMYLVCVPDAGAKWGSSVEVFDDLSNDGRFEFVLGAPFAPDPATGAGSILVFSGGEISVFPYHSFAYAGYPLNISGLGGIPPYDFTITFNSTGSYFNLPSQGVTYTQYSSPSSVSGTDYLSISDGYKTLDFIVGVYYLEPVTFVHSLNVSSLDFEYNPGTISDVIIAGIPQYNNNQGQINIYGVYSDYLGGITLPFPNPTTGDSLFGYSVAVIDDWNGDGIEDFVVSAPGMDIDILNLNTGAIYIYSGADYSFLYSITQGLNLITNIYFGAKVFPISDVDGDGIDDLAVVSTVPGAITLPATVNIVTSSTKTFAGSLSNAGIGNIGSHVEVIPLSEIKGIDLLAVGGPESDSIYFYPAPLTMLGYMPLFALTGPPSSKFGESFALFRDVNDDQIPDMAVGAPIYNSNSGEVRICYSQPTTTIFSFANCIGIPAPSSGGSSQEFGSTVINIGDINHDGYDEIAVGAPKATGGGKIYIIGTGGVFQNQIIGDIQAPAGATEFGGKIFPYRTVDLFGTGIKFFAGVTSPPTLYKIIFKTTGDGLITQQ